MRNITFQSVCFVTDSPHMASVRGKQSIDLQEG